MNRMNKLSDMMKGLQDLQGTMKEMSERLGSLRAEGESAGGMVRVCLRGDFTVESLFIDDSLFASGGAVLSDLIKAAMNEALGNLQKEMKENALGGIALPDGFPMPFS